MEFFDGAVVGTGGEKVRHARLPARVAEIRSDFRERDEHEFSHRACVGGAPAIPACQSFRCHKANIQIDLPGGPLQRLSCCPCGLR